MNAQLDSMLQKGQIWQAGRDRRAKVPLLSTGYPELDAALGGGLETGSLTELLADRPGSGELALLLPLLARASRQSRWIMLIDPPFIPFAPALEAAGIRLDRLLMVHSRGSRADAVWAMEQALQSGACSLVLGWISEISPAALRRLQCALCGRRELGILFRSSGAAQQPSTAAYRLRTRRRGVVAEVEILKRRRGWAGGAVRLDLRNQRASDALPRLQAI